MLAFSGRRGAGTVGTGPAGHWHCRRWPLRSLWCERPVRSTHRRHSPEQADQQETRRNITVRDLRSEGVTRPPQSRRSRRPYRRLMVLWLTL
jgi:hypothetical protein